MSEQNDPQAPEVDTPDPQHDEQTIDWQKRYTDLQPEYTRASQEAAQSRDLVARAQAGDPEALQALGLEIADQEEDTPLDDGLDPYDQRIAALEQRLEQQQSQAAETQKIQQIERHVEQELGKLEGLDETDRDIVVRLAIAMESTDTGMPDIQAAYDQLTQRDTNAQKRWAGTKRAPRVSPNGQAGTQSIPPSEMTQEQRVAFMAERLQASGE